MLALGRLRAGLLGLCLCLLVTPTGHAQRGESVMLGLVGVDGPVTVREASAALRGALPRFRRCYDERRAAKPGLAGRTLTRLFVSSEGSPLAAQTDASNLGDEALVECVEGVALTLRFRENERADSHIRFELHFGASGRPSGQDQVVRLPGADVEEAAPVTGAEPPRELRAKVHAEVAQVSRPRQGLEAAARRLEPRLLACYEAALTRQRDLEGELVFRLAVEARGRARVLDTEPGGVEDAALVACMSEVLASMRLPALRGRSADIEAQLRVTLQAPFGLRERPQ